ncbi:MAG: CinA family protein, partial [Candidatus Aureabacteria bacterium]|nr:CinA family protein [Candidatus Auribacterota bacterium]
STSDIAIGITGIAGPGGGSEEKPVGLVYVALDDGFISRTEEFKFTGTNREQVRERACRSALDLLRRYLLIE